MKIKEIKKLFEEDEGLKYALATNIAKYGRPQSKKSDKPAKLTKSLEKKREKAVKDLKKSMDEKVDLVHVMDKDGKMFGTGERVSTSGEHFLSFLQVLQSTQPPFLPAAPLRPNQVRKVSFSLSTASLMSSLIKALIS